MHEVLAAIFRKIMTKQLLKLQNLNFPKVEPGFNFVVVTSLIVLNFFYKYFKNSMPNELIVTGWIDKIENLEVMGSEVFRITSNIRRKDVKITHPELSVNSGFKLYVSDFSNLKGLTANNLSLRYSNRAVQNHMDSFFESYGERYHLGFIDYSHLSLNSKFEFFSSSDISIILFYANKYNLIYLRRFIRDLIFLNKTNIEVNNAKLIGPRLLSSEEMRELGWKTFQIDSTNSNFEESCIEYKPEFTKNLLSISLDNSSAKPLAGGKISFKDVVITCPQILIQNDKILEFDASLNPKFDFVAGRWHKLRSLDNGRSAWLTQQPVSDVFTRASGLFTKDDSNWFHWIIEGLPRLFHKSDSSFNLEEPLLISNQVSPEGRRLLNLITNAKKIIIDPDLFYKVKNYSTFLPINYHPDSLSVPPEKSAILNPVILRRFVTYILENMPKKSIKLPDKILFVRNSTRRMAINQLELIQLAIENGFEIIDPSKLDYESQFLLSQNARKIVTFGGAVMANFIFATRNTHIVTITSDQLKNFLMPFSLCQVSGAHHNYLLSKNIFEKHTNIYSKMHSSFLVSKESFIEMLRS